MKEIANVVIQGAVPVTLEMAKSFLKITNSHEDQLLQSIIESAIELFELETSKSILSRLVAFEGRGYYRELDLPRVDGEIVSVEVEDELGNCKLLEHSEYRIINGKIRFGFGVVMVQITMAIKPVEVSDIARNILLQIIAEFYKNRTAMVKLPAAIFSKLKKMRI